MKGNHKTLVPRFLCDEMLQGLARWLRAAGYDTQSCPAGTPDRKLLEQARNEQRWLITRDHKLQELRHAKGTVILLKSNGTEACAQELMIHVPVDWQLRPFTRCLLCNKLLTVAPAEKIEEIPSDSRKLADPLLECTQCGKLYWSGGHVERLTKKLKKLAS